MKRILSLILLTSLIFSFSSCTPKKSVTLLDAKGQEIASVSKMNFSKKSLSDERYYDFVTLALEEAVQIVMEKENLSREKAEKFLFQQEFIFKTALDPVAMTAIDTVYQNHKESGLPFGCSILNEEGMVCAVYSGGEENYALIPHAPASSFKPLSVYAPSMEKGLISWSTNIIDQPFKQVIGEDGKMKDWPTNPSTGYTRKSTTLVECVKQSLNTAAIYTLDQLGVKNSLKFLKDSFGMDLTYEENKMTIEGEEEILGNIGMGYLHGGVTPLEMAGFYRIFSQKGVYTKPGLIASIKTADESLYYERDVKGKQVIREDTAYMMNRLLTQVVAVGGTGEKAWFSDEVELLGKTGTGEDKDGNWFVGVTPQYSCAVWHGTVSHHGNIAAKLFGDVMKEMPAHTKTEFESCSTVRKGVYCCKSGDLATSACREIQVGYYAYKDRPSACPGH